PVEGVARETHRNAAFFFSSRRRHTRSKRDWSSDVCSSDLTITKRVNSTEPSKLNECQDRPLNRFFITRHWSTAMMPQPSSCVNRHPLTWKTATFTSRVILMIITPQSLSL